MDDDRTIIRAALQEWGRGEQQAGVISPEVSGQEINEFVEQYVEQITTAVRSSPLYRTWMETGHLRDHINHLLQRTGMHPDQSIYLHKETGQVIAPTWTHRDCGGDVYPAAGDFACSLCRKHGEIGLEVPEGANRMEYLLTEAREVDLI
jgi:hypothetical protein